MTISYSDGESVERQICHLLENTKDLSSIARIGSGYYSEWPVRYHLSPERGNLMRPFDFSGMDILEVGAGMGALSRVLAEQARSLHVVEGTGERFAGIRARLRDLNNWSGDVAEFSHWNSIQRFDLVAIIGVLEYAERFLDVQNPHQAFLSHAKKFLRPGGQIALAIENAVGIKYWGGAAEDHNGTLFDGIVGYSRERGPKTFSRLGLTQLLNECGFSNITFYYPFPDYKVPSCLLTDELISVAPDCAASLACHEPYQNYCTERVRYFPDSLVTQAMAHHGLLGNLSNSFLVFASLSSSSPEIRKHPEAIGWHFSKGECTELRSISVGVEVVKRGESQGLILGEPLRFEWARRAYFGEWTQFIESMRDFIGWSLSEHASGVGNGLRPEALDAIGLNAIRQGVTYKLFDLESHPGKVEKHWFIFRNVLGLIRDIEVLNQTAPFSTLAELYLKLCDSFNLLPDLESALSLESQLQFSTSPWRSEAEHRGELEKLFLTRLPPSRFPRDPNLEFNLRLRIAQLEAENGKFKAFLSKRSVKLARKAVKFVRRITPFTSHVRYL